MSQEYTRFQESSSPQLQIFSKSFRFTKVAERSEDFCERSEGFCERSEGFCERSEGFCERSEERRSRGGSRSSRTFLGFWTRKERENWIKTGSTSAIGGALSSYYLLKPVKKKVSRGQAAYFDPQKNKFVMTRAKPLKPFVCVEACHNLHNPKFVTVCSCNDFLRCAVCRKKRLKRTQKRVRDYMISMDIDKPKHHTMKFLTLTFKREGMSFDEARKKLLHSFTKLRKRKNWQKKVSFYFATLEVVEGNVHLHIVLTSSFWNQKELSDEWLKVSKTSFIVDIRKVTDIGSATKELAKYIAKDVSEDVLEEVAQFRDNNKKCRYVFSGRRPPSLDTIAITSPKCCKTCNHKVERIGQFKDQNEAAAWVLSQKRDIDGHIRSLSFPTFEKF